MASSLKLIGVENSRRIMVNRAEQSFAQTMLLFGIENTKVISESGAFPNFPTSDIVDTGAHRASQKLTFDSPREARLSWGMSYSMLLWTGATYRNGRVLEGRPWTKVAIKRFKGGKVFSTIYRGLL